jgi:signal transduction histidine kinase
MIFDLIVAIFIVQYLRRTLQTAIELPRWDNILRYILFGSIGLLVVDVAFSNLREIVNWLSHILLLYLIYILYAVKDLRAARQVLIAIAPYFLLSLVRDFFQLFDLRQLENWKDILDTLTGCALVYMLIMGFIINRQRKALHRERMRTLREEAQKNQALSLKDQLEIQVAERTKELTRQKEELQQALSDLKATQSQLIQSEKMASLGELTAGIAHEIQNPLNFVNNFSDLNQDLLDELKTELKTGNVEEAVAIADNIRSNEEKINHHGKRADGIVKGMLQHSRTSTGQKEPTDLNALADEYLRLAFHGWRAKDKSFNVTLDSDFDPAVGKIQIVPQEIGRVILNLLTNAFYAVNERKKSNEEGYQPIVRFRTKRQGNRVQISIGDNGLGIPASIVEKVFQPFFTTKPAGEGTGLGLSLCYDMITKGNGGELKLETKEGEGTTFTINLPA